ncbi:MAG: hypothetical protein JSR41_07610 [Proteobacteria bacterium]|nr:hypothetical protein [Pseudomonadota bacterium]
MKELLPNAFRMQKNAAARRGIEWHLTFEQWLAIWQASGKLDQRGIGKDRFVMARHGDVGPYALGNVEIITHSQDAKDSRANHPRETSLAGVMNAGTGRGWTFVRRRRRPYQVYLSKKYIGCFATAEEAESAYALAAVRHLEAHGVV